MLPYCRRHRRCEGFAVDAGPQPPYRPARSNAETDGAEASQSLAEIVSSGVDLHDVRSLMVALAKRRPIFHSEADFQHALAWELHTRYPDGAVRLEQQVLPGIHLDLALRDGRCTTAFELKYLTRGAEVEIAGERFILKQHGAQPPRRYDCVRDLVRLEALTSSGAADEGFAVVLTNDPAYWNAGLGDGGVGASFRIHQGRRLHGTLSWGGQTAPGTMHNRETALSLTGEYLTDWIVYGEQAAGLPYGICRSRFGSADHVRRCRVLGKAGRPFAASGMDIGWSREQRASCTAKAWLRTLRLGWSPSLELCSRPMRPLKCLEVRVWRCLILLRERRSIWGHEPGVRPPSGQGAAART